MLELKVEPAQSLDELGEVRGRLKKLKHSPGFLASVFDERDKQLCPRDLLVAWVPSRGKRAKRAAAEGNVSPDVAAKRVAGRRILGLLRRSLKFDKEQGKASLYIDFIWVMPEMRGRQVGRQLLLHGLQLGKQKDVRLLVAGSDANKAAVGLYSSVGFRWVDSTQSEMLLEAHHVTAAIESAREAMAAAAQAHAVAAAKLAIDCDAAIIDAPPRPASVAPSESGSWASDESAPAATGGGDPDAIDSEYSLTRNASSLSLCG